MLRVLCVAAMLALPASAGAQFVVPDIRLRYAVEVAEGTDSAVVASHYARWGLSPQQLYGPLWSVMIPAGQIRELGDSLRSVPWFRSLVLDELAGLQVTEDQAAAARPDAVPWNVSMIGADSVHARGITGAGQVIMVMDTGLDCDHPDLNVRGGYAFDATAVVGGEPAACASWDDTISSCKGHGTHVGGISQTVAPAAQLFGAHVFARSTSGDCLSWTSAQMAAIRMAADSGFVTVTSSIGGGQSGAMGFVLQDAATRNTWVAGASGNSASIMQGNGAHPKAVSVGSVASSGVRSSFSGQGGALDVMAPGQNIVSTMPGGNYGTKSGTSMAGPHVSGVIALMKQRKPDLTTQQLLLAINRTARDKGVAGWDASYGWGIIDALAIDDYLLAHPGTTMPPPTYTLSRSALTLSETTTPRDNNYMVDSVIVFPEIDDWTAVIEPIPTYNGAVYGFVNNGAGQGPTGKKIVRVRIFVALGIPQYTVWLEF
jgi:subtilisin